MRKIGITFDPPSSPVEMFTNGIRQNALYFAETLSLIGYDVWLIVEDSKFEKTVGLYGISDAKYIKLSEIFDALFDVVFQFSAEIPESFLEKFKQIKDVTNLKLVSYNCGNEYAFDLENTLFSSNYRKSWNNKTQYSKISDLLPIFDQIWSIPQMSNQNLHYWRTLYRCDSIEVPFIWSPKATDQYCDDAIKVGLGELSYKKRNSKKVAIFEPNINMFKWFFPALLVCENSYRKSKSIDHVFITNLEGNSRVNIDFVNEIVKPLDLKRDGRLSIESRYNTLYFMSHHADIAVSFQHENPLNYLYLDLAWWGWPIVHNAHLCKDIGYYYEGFNYEEGGKVLESVIKDHHLVADEYKVEMRKKIDRYLPSNVRLLERYRTLIESLF